MTSEDMASVMARAYAGRAWSASEITALLAERGTFAVHEGDQGFALGRVIADEAELLMIATDTPVQGQGVGRRVLARFMAEATRRGATEVFLEVAAGNAAALGLYRSAGFEEIARREGYYPRPDGHREDAIVMRAQAVP